MLTSPRGKANNPRRTAGFTLIELLVVVSILSILSVGLPAWRSRWFGNLLWFRGLIVLLIPRIAIVKAKEIEGAISVYLDATPENLRDRFAFGQDVANAHHDDPGIGFQQRPAAALFGYQTAQDVVVGIIFVGFGFVVFGLWLGGRCRCRFGRGMAEQGGP